MLDTILLLSSIIVASISSWFITRSYKQFESHYEKKLVEASFVFILISIIVLIFRLIESLGYPIFGFMFYLVGSINFLYLIYRLFDLSQERLDSKESGNGITSKEENKK